MTHHLRKAKAGRAQPLTVVWRRIEVLRPDPASPRSHSPRQVHLLALSIGAFGFNVPILVDPTLRIIAGHGGLLREQLTELSLAEPDLAIGTTGFEPEGIDLQLVGGLHAGRKRLRSPAAAARLRPPVAPVGEAEAAAAPPAPTPAGARG